MERTTDVYFPRWAVRLYVVLVIVLIPWILDLADYLPSSHLAHHWDTLWVGFDIIMLLTIIITLILAFKRRVWAAISGTALATLFIVDAWFDILTARPGKDLDASIAFGVVEVVLSILTMLVVTEVVKSTSTHQHKIRINQTD